MPTYPLRFFGPGLILDQHSQPIALRSRKQLALLVYLTTEHATTHSRETLMALFWPEEATPSAQNNLRVTLARVRELANKLAVGRTLPSDLLHTDRHTVQLDAAWVEQADVNHCYALLEKTLGHDHPSRSQCAHCQAALHEAVQCYGGEFLAGLGLEDCPAFEEWLFVQRERLRLLVIEAYTDLALFAEANSDWHSAGEFVQRQIELDSLRELAYRQQMRILSKQGERSAALASFERCRALLNEELGLDPSPETLALHTQILLGEGSAPTQSSTTEPMSTAPSAAPRHALPQQLTPFIGREEEIAQIQARLADPTYRLLSIVGPGGIGKSRLAQQVAAQQLERFADGVYFVALAQVSAVEAIPAAIAETLGLTFSTSQQSRTTQLCTMIGPKQMLLVLDNFEHLMAGVDLLMELLRQAPRVVLLVTSRERFNLQAEDLFELQGLPTPASSADVAASTFAAVRLFVDRAHRLDKGFKLTGEQLPHVVRICQLVEGFPLAIELAATWVRDLGCAEIVTELTTGLDLLETTLRDIDPQHRSLRAVFNASWRLLASEERRALTRLAVFRGGFTLDAAQAVAEAGPVLISALRNKSLLRHAGTRRYDMHALVQQFSAEALATDRPATAQVQHAHSHYFLRLLADQATALDTREAGVAGDRIQADWENVVVGWQQATAQAAFPLLQDALDGLVRFCDLRGLYQEVEMLLAAAVACVTPPLAPPLPNPPLPGEGTVEHLTLLCRLLTAQIYFAECRGDYERTVELAPHALALAHQLDSPALLIGIYLNQAKAFELIADYRQGSALAEKTLALAQAAGLELQAGISMELLGYNAFQLGDYERSQEIYQRLIAFHEQTGRLELATRLAISILGSIAVEQGSYERGLHYYQRFLAASEATTDRVNTAHAYRYLANVWNQLGDYAQALAMAAHSSARASALGDENLRRGALFEQAFAHRQRGELAAALACATEAVALAHRSATPVAVAAAVTQLAEVQLALAKTEHDWAAAAANFHEAASNLRVHDKLPLAYTAEIGLAELARRRGELADAQRQLVPILPHLPTLTAAGWDEPVRAYVVCTHILQAAHDPAAAIILDQGLHLLDCLAQKISDANLRQNFLHAIPAHRDLQALRLAATVPSQLT